VHEPLRVVGEWLGRVVRGYYQYHAVPYNFEALTLLKERVSRYWWHMLRKRSQTGLAWRGPDASISPDLAADSSRSSSLSRASH